METPNQPDPEIIDTQRKGDGMIMPLEQLIQFDGNAYEMTVVVTRRAYQLGIIHDEEVVRNNGKVVSMATQQLFEKSIEYRIIED